MKAKLILTNLIIGVFLSTILVPTIKAQGLYDIEFGSYNSISTNDFIRLMTAWFPISKLKIFESADLSRTPEDEWEIIDDQRPKTTEYCRVSSDCTGYVIVQNTISGATQTVNPTCNGTPEQKDRNEGKCEFDNTTKIGGSVIGTDFSEDTIEIPKLQDSLSRYSQAVPKSNAPIFEYGTEQLLLTDIEQFRQRVVYARKALATYETVNNSDKNPAQEFPLGGVDYDQIITCNGKAIKLLTLANSIPQKIRSLSEGWREEYKLAIKNAPEWFLDLQCINPYRNTAEDAYMRTSIVLFGNAQNYDVHSGIYKDYRTQGTLDAAINEARRTMTSSQFSKFAAQIQSDFPIISHINDPSLAAIPSNLIKEGINNNIFTEKDFGDVADGIDVINNTSYSDLNIIGNREEQTAGAVQESNETLLSSITSTFVGLINEILNIKKHAITIPGPAGQILEEIQNHTYLTTVSAKDNSSTKMTKLSNSLVTTTNNTLAAGSSTIPGKSKDTFSRYMSCKSKDFSDFDFSVEQYAQGYRETCEPTLLSNINSCDDFSGSELTLDNMPKGNGFTTNCDPYFGYCVDYRNPDINPALSAEEFAGFMQNDADEYPDNLALAKCPGGITCYEYVIEAAKQAGWNPAWVLAHWAAETHASALVCAGVSQLDFGINDNSVLGLPAQLERLLNLSYSGTAFENYMKMFSEGSPWTSTDNTKTWDEIFIANPHHPYNMLYFYSIISGGSGIDCFPEELGHHTTDPVYLNLCGN